MQNLKLTIELLPKGAWNNDLSKTLAKKDWNVLREFALARANGECEICGYKTNDLDVHEEWEFDVKKKTQTLKNIIAICSKCHGVKHFKNSVRLGYGQQAAAHFIKTNNCSEMEFSSYLLQAQIKYEELNTIYRWEMIANLENFGGKNVELYTYNIPLIHNPYDKTEWNILDYRNAKNLFNVSKNNLENLIGTPKVISIKVNNYQGIITVQSLFTDRIEWSLDGKKIKTKYNKIGKFTTELSVKNLMGNLLSFTLFNNNGSITSKNFILGNN